MHRTSFIAKVLLALPLAAAVARMSTAAEITVDFEELSLANESFYNGDPGGFVTDHDGSFFSQGVKFSNTFTRADFGGFSVEFWSGWSYSNITDNTTPGFANQYSAFPGGGSGGSQNYGVSFGSPGNAMEIPADYTLQSIDITNTTYAALSMRDGDSFAKQFGGPTGNDEDFFKLIISGYSGGESGTLVGEVEFYLADYRFADNSLDFIVDEWTTVDLTSLAAADTLTFSYESSDVGQFGINTPVFFAADNLVLGTLTVPEPSSWVAMIICAAPLLLARRWIMRRTDFQVRSKS